MNRIDIDATLRSLDPADRRIDLADARARSDLEAILATDPAPPARQRPPSPSPALTARPRGAARTTRRIVLAGGVAATVGVGLVVLPPLTGGDHAFATWTTAPVGMSAQQSAEAAADCREQYGDVSAEQTDDLSRAETAVAERRGVWTTVVLAGPAGFSAMCITDDSAGLFTNSMIGSIGTLPAAAAPGPRELVATDLGVGTMSAGDISMAAGTAGPDVVGVVYRSSTHGEVAATVSRGRFALWLPGDDLRDASSTGVELEVSYRDGTTATSRLTF